MAVHILSGGAALGLVNGVRERFLRESGHDIEGEFGAVGLMRDKLLAGAPCDIAVLSRRLIDALAADGKVDPASVSDLGVVSTGVAVKEDQEAVPVDTQDALRHALLQADSIFVPSMSNSTAGMHMKQVFATLGVLEEIAPRISEHPNGATAMKAMAVAPGKPIGCTQVTEIAYSAGIKLLGRLPEGCGLDTVYTAAITRDAPQAQAARLLISIMTDPGLAPFKTSIGFTV